MSRHVAYGVDPETNNEVEVAYGYDPVPYCEGYFVQVFDLSEIDNYDIDPSGEGMIINIGFTTGADKSKCIEIMKEYNVPPNIIESWLE